MLELLESAGYMAHGYCLLWQPWLVTLYAGSDLLIFVSYAVIPIALLRLVRLRPDIGNRGLLTLFAAFILLCGLTHLVSVATLWVPVYELHGWLKLLTGLVSAATAFVLFPLVPRLAAIPAPARLQEANEKLTAEIEAHDLTLEELRRTHDGLEAEVAERTAELRAVNERLNIVLQETAHRGNNMVTVIQSLARQTARHSPDIEAFQRRFGDRLMAIARATNATVRGGDDPRGDFMRMAELQLDAYEDRITIDGPRVALSTEAGQQLGLALHELATNAIKYGALSTSEGRIALHWTVDAAANRFELTWTETGCGSSENDAGDAPSTGLGTKLVNHVVPAQLGGEASSRLSAQGFVYRLVAPLVRILPEAAGTAADPDPGRDFGEDPGLLPG